MMKWLTIILLLFPFNPFGLKAQIVFQEIDYAKAKELAKQENKPLFIEFYTDWCQPCKQLSANVFSDEELSQLVNDSTIAIKINADIETSLIKDLNVTAYPTVLLFDFESQLMKRLKGVQPAGNYIKEVQIALHREKTEVYQMTQKYKAGERSVEFIASYLEELIKYERDIQEIGDTYLNQSEVDYSNYHYLRIIHVLQLEYDNQYIQSFLNSLTEESNRSIKKSILDNSYNQLYQSSFRDKDISKLKSEISKHIDVIRIFYNNITEEEFFKLLVHRNEARIDNLILK